MDFKRKVWKLKNLVIKNIYYQLLNTSNIFRYNAWTYCKCDEFQGCRLKPRNRLENGDRSYCFICRVQVEYHAEKIENLKNIGDIINNFLAIKTDMLISHALIMINHVISFGCIITKQVQWIVLNFVHGNMAISKKLY